MLVWHLKIHFSCKFCQKSKLIYIMMKMKLNENGSKTLSEVLSQSDGPFSKTLNVMLALELMEKGTELASNQVTKLHLANIIKALCAHLEWTEEI